MRRRPLGSVLDGHNFHPIFDVLLNHAVEIVESPPAAVGVDRCLVAITTQQPPSQQTASRDLGEKRRDQGRWPTLGVVEPFVLTLAHNRPIQMSGHIVTRENNASVARLIEPGQQQGVTRIDRDPNLLGVEHRPTKKRENGALSPGASNGAMVTG